MRTVYTKKSWDEIQQCVRDQKELCATKDLPHFAPHDGMCYYCGYNVYQNGETYPGRDGKSLVTGCPHCHYSFCD